MRKFRSKPTTCYAEQYTGPACVPFGEPIPSAPEGVRFLGHDGVFLPTVETAHKQIVYLQPGDWVIREPNGDGYYPVSRTSSTGVGNRSTTPS